MRNPLSWLINVIADAMAPVMRTRTGRLFIAHAALVSMAAGCIWLTHDFVTITGSAWNDLQKASDIITVTTLGMAIGLTFPAWLSISLFINRIKHRVPPHYNAVLFFLLVVPPVFGAAAGWYVHSQIKVAGYVRCDPTISRTVRLTYGKSYDACLAAGYSRHWTWPDAAAETAPTTPRSPAPDAATPAASR